MKKVFAIVIISLLTYTASLADNLKLIGNVGSYDVEMIIETSDYETGQLTGKYKYLSQENYLILKGDNYGDVIYMEEFYNDEQTGTFYLENVDNQLIGWWTNNEKALKVELNVEDGDKSYFNVKGVEEFSAECNSDISGTYRTEYFFINDYFATEDNPVYELGFNGGSATFEELEDGSLKFEIELICGPTYHFAIAEGIAVKQGDVYLYSANEWETEENCEITFKFENKSVYATSNNGFACGFGAKAYMDHSLKKVGDFGIKIEN